MSQDFKFNFEKNNEDTTSKDVGSAVAYSTSGNIRNICFVLIDGTKLFLSYSYLVSGEHSPAESTITLNFTSISIILKGIHLEPLFFDIMLQMPKMIVAVDERYNATISHDLPIVNDIEKLEADN